MKLSLLLTYLIFLGILLLSGCRNTYPEFVGTFVANSLEYQVTFRGNGTWESFEYEPNIRLTGTFTFTDDKLELFYDEETVDTLIKSYGGEELLRELLGQPILAYVYDAELDILRGSDNTQVLTRK